MIHKRTVRDATGVVWLISERDAHSVPGAMGPTCLVFDSQTVCRRYWHYPSDWLILSDGHLLELMSQSRQSRC